MISSCSYKVVLDSKYYCEKLKFNCLKENKIVSFKTSKGEFDVELYAENYPVTVTNFIENIKKNVYQKKKFYKVINYPQVQVIHSGVFSENIYYREGNQHLSKLGPSIPLEIKLKKGIEPKYSQEIENPSEVVNLKTVFEKGSLAMVKIGEMNSSSTEFFFVTNKFPELDGRYSIFGKVIKGIEILKRIDKDDLIHEILISN